MGAFGGWGLNRGNTDNLLKPESLRFCALPFWLYLMYCPPHSVFIKGNVLGKDGGGGAVFCSVRFEALLSVVSNAVSNAVCGFHTYARLRFSLL